MDRFASLAGKMGLAVALACGCSSGDAASSDPESSDQEIKITARCQREIGSKIRAKVDSARSDLETFDTSYARTLKTELSEHRLDLLPFCAMTRTEYTELEKSIDLTDLGGTPDERYAQLRQAEAPILRSVHAQLYGFQWENRIYLSTGMSDSRMLKTLAHEAMHVLRKAHLRNYDDQRVVCVEELEAYKAEVLVERDELTESDIDRLRRSVEDVYELDKLRPESCTYR